MKNKTAFLILVILALLCQSAFAAVTLTSSKKTYFGSGTAANGNQYVITMVCTLSNTGSVTTPWPIDGYVMGIETIPGATAPTSGYGITVTDANSLDIMGGALASRSSTLPEFEMPWVGASKTPAPIAVPGYLTANFTGNSVAGAIVTLKITVQR